jgi:hypothetical protein
LYLCLIKQRARKIFGKAGIASRSLNLDTVWEVRVVSFTPRLRKPEELAPSAHFIGRLDGSQSRSKGCVEVGLLRKSGTESRFIGSSARGLVTLPTELIHCNAVCIFLIVCHFFYDGLCLKSLVRFERQPVYPLGKAFSVKVRCQALRHEGVRGSIDPHFLDLGTKWRWVVSFTPWPHYPRGKISRYPLDRRLDGPQSRSGRRGEEKILDHNGTRTPTPRSSSP